ncbi:MAG: adenylosuccinate synthase [Bdellovibrionales bacterium CG10_big_fil_rev_8_21_14_0_10_45_34]|nr:MAG: adenylosuccinate synthase [Bdellovibrionales bacterium CG10_big_fil_rev_8_21_14_0_10_45_34]
MPAFAVVGAQWGDEGKGKIVDLFGKDVDFVIRFQGGSNAGHTLVINGVKTVLHLVPSGIFHPHVTCALAPGVVIDIEKLTEELSKIKDAGLVQRPGQFLISDDCTVILPFHKALDQARESDSAGTKIGTTGRGIGPAYEDRASRRCILFRDLFEESVLRSKLEIALKEKNALFETVYKSKTFSVDELIKWAKPFAAALEEFRCQNLSFQLHQAHRKKKHILFEGAQGSLLDVYHGTFPFVTSSSTLAASACTSAGVGPAVITRVVGVTKAYTTRVGEGPFPTELDNELGEHLRSVGGEFGATTGRSRRCGWLDLVALKHAIRINGITNLVLTKLDVLTAMDEIKVCTHYRIDDLEPTAEYPMCSKVLKMAQPVLKSFKGWKEPIDTARSVRDLPREAQEYISFLGVELGTPIDLISVGPGREQNLWIKPLFSE